MHRKRYIFLGRVLVILFIFMLWISHTLGGHDAVKGYVLSGIAFVLMALLVVGHALTSPSDEE
jgi:hypothetical protein